MNYLYLRIDSAINRVNFKIGFVASGSLYRDLNNQLSKLVDYKQQLDKDYSLQNANRIERNFNRFCEYHNIICL